MTDPDPTPTATRDGGRSDPVADPAAPFPSDPLDGWEPGLPPLRTIAPSAIGGAVVPLAVYYLVRSHVGSDADALAIAGIPASIWVMTQFIRRRRIDPIGSIVLFGFVLGLTVSFAMGGNAFVLKVRDSGFTFLFGLASLLSAMFGRRPITFHIGKALSAGSDPRRQELYDQLWETAPARATFRLINIVWGVGLMGEAATRVVLAADLSTKSFVAISPVVGGLYLGSMGLFTIWLVGRSRRRAPLVVEVPAGGGTTWWWLRAYLRPVGATAPARRPEL